MPKDLFVSALLDVYGDFLNERQRELAVLYYNEDLSLGEIAENEGITRQGVRDSIKRAEEQLYRLEERCGYQDKFDRLRRHSAAARSGDRESMEKIAEIIDSL